MNKKQFVSLLRKDEEENIHAQIVEFPGRISNYRRLARRLSARGEIEAALYILNLAARRFPGDRELVHQIARSCEADGRTRRAENLYRRLISEDPNRPAPYEWLERLLLKRSRRKEAAALWRSVGPQNPLRKRALKRAAAVYKDDGKLPQARKTLKQLIREFGDDFQKLKDIGRLYEKDGMRAEALKYYERAWRMKPDHADTGLLAGVCCRKAGKRKKARLTFQKILGFAPENYGAQIHLAEMAIEDGEPAEAKRLLDRLESRWPGNSRIKINRARLLLGEKRLPEAEKLCREGLKAAPFYYTDELSLGHSVLAEILEEKGESEESEYFRMVGERCRGGGDFYRILVDLIDELVDEERLAEAEMAAEEMLRQFPGNSLALIKKAEVQRKLGHWKRAVEAAREAAREDNPRYLRDRVSALRLLGELYRQRGRKEEAAEALREAEAIENRKEGE